MTEEKHLVRTIRWSPQGFEWESNSKHVEDTVELCGQKLESKGAPTPITKVTGRRRRDNDDTLNETDDQTVRQAAGTELYMSIDRPSLQFAMSVVMSGMSEPKVVHQLHVVRVARYVLQHPGEAWLFGNQADPKTLYASSRVFRRGRVSRHCQGRGDIEANITDLGTDLDAIGGDPCIRQQCSTRNMHQDGIQESATSFNERVVDTRIVSQERAPVGVGRHAAELGGHWNESTHTSERLTSLLRQVPQRLGEGHKQALACLVKSNENSGPSHGRDGEDCDAWFDLEECDGCHGEEDRDG